MSHYKRHWKEPMSQEQFDAWVLCGGNPIELGLVIIGCIAGAAAVHVIVDKFIPFLIRKGIIEGRSKLMRELFDFPDEEEDQK